MERKQKGQEPLLVEALVRWGDTSRSFFLPSGFPMLFPNDPYESKLHVRWQQECLNERRDGPRIPRLVNRST